MIPSGRKDLSGYQESEGFEQESKIEKSAQALDSKNDIMNNIGNTEKIVDEDKAGKLGRQSGSKKLR